MARGHPAAPPGRSAASARLEGLAREDLHNEQQRQRRPDQPAVSTTNRPALDVSLATGVAAAFNG
ncbi:hypothetical protein GCM10027168_44120 [Streptomyces capparidis]